MKPRNPDRTPNRFRAIKRRITMAHPVIEADECIACGACAAECPVNAISEGDGKYVIDAATCTECGSCANICPVGAPKAE